MPLKTTRTVLTQRERDVLILSAKHPGDTHVSNADLARRLGLSVSSVKAAIHRACVKLGAHNRRAAVMIAVQRGEIRYDELLPPDELAETLASLGPAGLRRIARLVRQADEDGFVPDIDAQIIPVEHRPDSRLTNRERDVVVLAGRGLSNREIADTLCMSVSAVRTFLTGAATKLGAKRREDTIMLALKQGDVAMGEMYSPEELLRGLGRLGAESIEEIAQLLEHKAGQEPASTDS